MLRRLAERRCRNSMWFRAVDQQWWSCASTFPLESQGHGQDVNRGRQRVDGDLAGGCAVFDQSVFLAGETVDPAQPLTQLPRIRRTTVVAVLVVADPGFHFGALLFDQIGLHRI